MKPELRDYIGHVVRVLNLVELPHLLLLDHRHMRDIFLLVAWWPGDLGQINQMVGYLYLESLDGLGGALKSGRLDDRLG